MRDPSEVDVRSVVWEVDDESNHQLSFPSRSDQSNDIDSNDSNISNEFESQSNLTSVGEGKCVRKKNRGYSDDSSSGMLFESDIGDNFSSIQNENEGSIDESVSGDESEDKNEEKGSSSGAGAAGAFKIKYQSKNEDENENEDDEDGEEGSQYEYQDERDSYDLSESETDSDLQDPYLFSSDHSLHSSSLPQAN